VVRILAVERDFPLLPYIFSGCGAYPASCSTGTGVLSREVKRPGLEVDHPPPATAEIKNEWRYTSAVLI
jgi:hypothetical protein